jgi:hypothetical protein
MLASLGSATSTGSIRTSGTRFADSPSGTSGGPSVGGSVEALAAPRMPPPPPARMPLRRCRVGVTQLVQQLLRSQRHRDTLGVIDRSAVIGGDREARHSRKGTRARRTHAARARRSTSRRDACRGPRGGGAHRGRPRILSRRIGTAEPLGLRKLGRRLPRSNRRRQSPGRRSGRASRGPLAFAHLPCRRHADASKGRSRRRRT